MSSIEEMEEFIERTTPVLKLIVQTQWDFVSFQKVQHWLDINFKNDVEGRFYAMKILSNLIYYTQQDIIALLKFGIFEKIYGEVYKETFLQHTGYYNSATEKTSAIQRYRDSSLFCPIMDSKKPYESGNVMISNIVHHLEISASNADFHWNLSEEKLERCQFLIFVDDCFGSGSQLRNFFDTEEIKNVLSLAKKFNTQIYCLALIGYKKNYFSLKDKLEKNKIKLITCELLSEKHRIFSDESIVWNKKNDEKLAALSYFKKLQKDRGIGYVGFKKLDFAVILHNRTPNWSLPIIWKKTQDWDNLLQRKSSN